MDTGPKFQLPERIGNEHIYVAEKDKLPTALNQLEDGQSSSAVSRLVAPSFGEGEIQATFTRRGDDLDFTGVGTMNQTKDATFGPAKLLSGGSYEVEIQNTKLTRAKGDFMVDMAGALLGHVSGELMVQEGQFSGTGELEQTAKFGTDDVYLENGKASATVAANEITEGTFSADLVAPKIGKGRVEGTVAPGGEGYLVSGTGTLTQDTPIQIGTIVVTDSNFGGEVLDNAVTKITGDGNVQLADVVSGTFIGEYAVEEESFDGEAEVTQIGEIGDEVAKVTDASAKASIVANELAAASAQATVTVMQFAQGAFTGQLHNDGGDMSVSGTATLDQLQDLEAGPVVASEGHFEGELDHNKVTKVAGSGKIALADLMQGSFDGSYNPDDGTISGTVALDQLTQFGAEALYLNEAHLEGQIEANALTNTSGSAKLVAPSFGEGTFEGAVDLTPDTPLASGTGSIDQTQDIVAGPLTATGGEFNATVADNKLTQLSGMTTVKLGEIGQGDFLGDYDVEAGEFTGDAELTQLADITAGPVALTGSSIGAHVEKNALTEVTAQGKLVFDGFGEGTFDGNLDTASEPYQASGKAELTQTEDVNIAGVARIHSGAFSGTLENNALTGATGQGSIAVDGIGEGSFQGEVINPLTEPIFTGQANVEAAAGFDLGGAVVVKKAALGVHINENKLEKATGEAAVELPALTAEGTLTELTYDFETGMLSGVGTLKNTAPLEAGNFQLTTAEIVATLKDNELEKVEVIAELVAGEAYKGSIMGEYDAGSELVSGTAELEQTTPQTFLSIITIEGSSLTVDVVDSKLTKATGSGKITISEKVSGELTDAQYDFEKEEVSGTGTVGLVTPIDMGPVVLSEGSATAQIAANQVQSVEGGFKIDVSGFGEGTAQGAWTADKDTFTGEAQVTQTEVMDYGVIAVEGCKISVSMVENTFTEAGVAGAVVLKGIGRGSVDGTFAIEEEEFSGKVKVDQIDGDFFGFLEVTGGGVEGTLEKNKLTSGSGDITVSMPKIGKGVSATIEANFENTGEGDPTVWGSGLAEFKPHDRVSGMILVNLSKDQKISGEGEVDIQITDTIEAKANVVVDEEGNTKIAGEIMFADEYQLLKGKKDEWKLGLPPIEWSPWGFSACGMRFGVLAGVSLDLGIAYGLDGLVLKNIFAKGDIDLSDPSMGSLQIGGTLSTEAYAEAFARLQLYVALGLGVASIEGGAYATAKVRVGPKVEMNALLDIDNSGVNFRADFDATIAAALMFELGFYAAVKVVLWGEVWRKEKPAWSYALDLGDFGVGGFLEAGSNGFDAGIEPRMPPALEGGEMDVSDLKGDMDDM